MKKWWERHDKMKILLTTLNAKYIHSNLALRYLKSACSHDYPLIEMIEFTINDAIENIIYEIYKTKAVVVGFSCYIWNIEMILRMVPVLKKLCSDTKIILGGPEVSFDAYFLLHENPDIDFIIKGEGEESFLMLLDYLDKGKWELNQIPGLVYRVDGLCMEHPDSGYIKQLSLLPDPYQDGIHLNAAQIVYYESSRGCPFQCQYCLSSIQPGVRFLPLDRVFKELKYFIESDIKLVKFVDRTFNADSERACSIFEYILSLRGKTVFHFELGAHLINQRMMYILKNAPVGIFQFEIGVQTTNQVTLELINRKFGWKDIHQPIRALIQQGNIHIHLDLIAGLPAESEVTFKNSFDDVYLLEADRLQLGFLKLLKGSGLRRNAKQFGYKYFDTPPYEVISNHDIRYETIRKLKGIENLLEKYKNSHHYENSIRFMVYHIYKSPYDFFEAFWLFWEQKKYYTTGKSSMQLLDILYEFGNSIIREERGIWIEILKLDYIMEEKRSIRPEWMSSNYSEELQEDITKFYRNEIVELIPDLQGLSSRQRWKLTHIERFSFDLLGYLVEFAQQIHDPMYLLFNYMDKGSIIKIHIHK